MSPMNASDKGVSATMASMVLVRKKAETETREEAVRRSVREAGRERAVVEEEQRVRVGRNGGGSSRGALVCWGSEDCGLGLRIAPSLADGK